MGTSPLGVLSSRSTSWSNLLKIVDQEDLYFKDSSSDKEYHVYLVDEGQSYSVKCEYGRRGNTLQTVYKIQNVRMSVARAKFTKAVSEKRTKGYTSGITAKPYTQTTLRNSKAALSNWLPQLLRETEESDLEELFKDDAWIMQPKADGKRILIERGDGIFSGINRRGMYVPMPDPVGKLLETLPGEFVLDGEMIGDTYHLFDLLKFNAHDLTKMAYDSRLLLLETLIKPLDPSIVRVLPTARVEQEKRSLFDKVKDANGEGVVFRRAASHYAPGRPNSGGDVLKFKFVASATCYVWSINSKRSVTLALFNDKSHAWQQVGSCTIPPNYDVPQYGEIVEIRYLYAYDGGSLYQPVYQGKRDDMDRNDCCMSQLKYKATTTV
jgi:bifunctional non-homologous end joining protein LigD